MMVTEQADRGRLKLQQAITGFRLSMMISVAAKLRVADLIGDGEKTIDELADATRTHRDSLYRVLRTLAGFGIFFEGDNQKFRLNESAHFLRADVAGSLQAMAEVMGEEWMWHSWGDLLHTVRTGQMASEHLYGQDPWSYFEQHPEAGALFNRFMEEMSSADCEAICSAYDFAGKTVVDVAGGQGVVLLAIMRQYPTAKAVLFNLPFVLEGVRREIFEHLNDRVQFVAGSFFDEVPAGGDVYILKNIIHDWDNEHAIEILSKCRAAMVSASRLLIVEHLVSGPNERCAGKMTDVNMMVRNGGRNRTSQELMELLSASGLRYTRTVLPRQGPAVVEASPTP